MCSKSGTRLFYINAVDWIKDTFRAHNFGVTNDQYHSYLMERIRDNPDLIIDNLTWSISILSRTASFVGNPVLVIDGIFSPRDFCKSFDYNKDIVVFLNRTDGEHDTKNYEYVGISVIRDYCFWLSSTGLLSKDRWLEYNFKIPGDDSASIRKLGVKNSVYIVRSITKVVPHLLSIITELK
jgi:hypothetical protein